MSEDLTPDLVRVAGALTFAERETELHRDPQLPAMHRELEDWLGDDRQWVAAYRGQWVSLIDDLLLGLDACGTAMTAYLKQGDEPLWSELSDCRLALGRQKQGRGAPDPAIRRRLQRASKLLGELLGAGDAREAAWQDVVAAGSHLLARDEATRLGALVTGQGLDLKQLFRQLCGILEDDLTFVEMARGETVTPREERDGPAGADEQERVALAKATLLEPPRSADTVYWLRYALAPMPSQPVLAIGESVTLYRAAWLNEALKAGSQHELPAELKDDYGRDRLEVLSDRSVPKGEEKERVPYALIRVALGEVRLAEAEALARETAELLVSLATLHSPASSIWILTNDHLAFRDGATSSMTSSAPPVFEPSFDQKIALSRDNTPTRLAEWSERLAEHLPLRDLELRDAAQLALWLRRTRQTWEPGRLVLLDRIFEQVAGWAGVSDRGGFIHEYLRLGWALGRVYHEVSDCWADVFFARTDSFGQPGISDEAWAEIEADPELGYEPRGDGWKINLPGVLLRLEFLVERVEEGSPLQERLQRLRDRTATGNRTAAWIAEGLKAFDVLENRSRRIRNSLIHGGAVSDEAAEAILPFVEWLAADALHHGIQGLLADDDVVDHFIDMRIEEQACLARLRNDEPAWEALWHRPRRP